MRAFEEIEAALEDEEFQSALSKASLGTQAKVEEVLRSRPELLALAEEVREIKRAAIARLDELLEQAMNSLRAVRATPHLAETAEEAREIVGKLIGRGKLVVLSKSMAAAEVGLRPYLEAMGNEVWETDLGELLIQLEGTKPMHTITPAVHMSRRRAVELLEKAGAKVEGESIESAVRAAREFLRGKIVRAQAGITGANALAADTGAIVTVENESNVRLVSSLPPLHIALVPVDKVVPTLMDAIKVAMVQSAFAGLYPPTYINVISGPSSTADIERTRVYGAQGPVEQHVVFIDNGRTAARKGALAEQLYCIRCGRCQYECPVWIHTANRWGGPVYGGPMGLVWTAITYDANEAAKLSFLCLGCGRCDEACPVGIPLSRLIRELKAYAMRDLK
ncbi:MAG: lactate utilization protein [Acidilobaceae archaeon]|nr:lactate utilization protein [Acidilobaceae archaeon]MCX8166176.1 lactate utilization protein [Acidilobaceae archaeon]MDW7974814.1 lactate utilization protein B [Sulfolobales archaeon]